MNLPAPNWQLIYGHVAWSLLLSGLLLRLLSPLLRDASRVGARRGVVLAVFAAFAVGSVLPVHASPVYWLGLAFQWPSVWLTALAAVSVWREWIGTPRAPQLMPTPLALAVAAAGAVLYLDSVGFIAVGLYPLGFSPGAVLVATGLLGLASVVAISRAWGPASAAGLLAALLVFAALRLPTGNGWDAVLDPFLCVGALLVLITRAVRSLWARRRLAEPATPALAGVDRWERPLTESP